VNFDKIFVFTDFDLDGTVSLLELHWFLNAKPGQIKFKSTTVSNFRREYLSWLNDHKPTDYEKIYILDLDVSNNADLVDKENFVIIDHHLTHSRAVNQYKSAKVNVVETTSCAKLLYKLYGPVQLTTAQKTLVAIADDYDSYTLKLPQSYEMNCLLLNLQKSAGAQKAEKFIARFYEGFTGFNSQENNIIKDHIIRRDKTIKELQIFKGSVSIQGKQRTIYGTSGDKFVNEVCDYLIKKHNAEIAFFVNTNAGHVSFRKTKNCEIDLSKLAAKLCEGGGHEYAAGGKITDTFMNFTKLLGPL
jgi:oligoribonuclease NrnB/cAMP/cGMP phosphodiesterase (DHH superfamily)